MKNQHSSFSSIRPFIKIVSLCSLSVFGFVVSMAAKPDFHCSAVSGAVVPGSNSGDACVMVFGKVGDTLRYQLQAPARKGTNANGEICMLPKGLELNRETGILRGVPTESGFHEMVLLITEKGQTREVVYLIDIVGQGVDPMRSTCASLFLGAVN